MQATFYVRKFKAILHQMDDIWQLFNSFMMEVPII